MQTQPKRKQTGIERRPLKGGGFSYRAEVFDRRTGKRIRRTFPTAAAAKAWRADTMAAVQAGELATESALTVANAASELLVGMENGTIRTRKGTPYKPSACRGYRRSFEKRLLPAFGKRKLADVRRRDVQAFIDKLVAEGLDGSTVRNTIDPLRVLYRRALTRERVTVNPMQHLEVPAPAGRRDRIASPEEATRLVEAVPIEHRPIWATALYAGLRRGELRGLRWGDVDLASGVIRVERGWDPREGAIEGKSRSARRTVPITALLRDYLVEHRLRRGQRPADALMFGQTDAQPFDPSMVDRRAKAAWKRAKLTPITMHECRHTFASIGIAAGLNAKALSSYLGHASVAITYDRYGKLMPGNEAEAAGLLDAYLLRSVPVGQSGGSSAPPAAVLSGPERTAVGGAIPVPEPELA